MTTINEIPADDLIEHEHTKDCVCGPKVEVIPSEDGQSWKIIHYALDGRDLYDQDERHKLPADLFLSFLSPIFMCEHAGHSWYTDTRVTVRADWSALDPSRRLIVPRDDFVATVLTSSPGKPGSHVTHPYFEQCFIQSGLDIDSTTSGTVTFGSKHGELVAIAANVHEDEGLRKFLSQERYYRLVEELGEKSPQIHPYVIAYHAALALKVLDEKGE